MKPLSCVSAENFLTFYTVFLLHKPGYYIKAASSYPNRDSELLEKTQRNRKKLIPRKQRHLYDDRLAKIDPFFLPH